MASKEELEKNERMAQWLDAWDKRDIKFHQSAVNRVLKEQICSLDPKRKNVFVPLCGKTLDMRWLADEGYTVVGLDGAKVALEDFFTEQGLEWTEKDVSNMGPGCQILQTKEGNIKLYCGDIMLFNQSLEGQFDVIWDRASLVAMNREDVQKYIHVMEDILCPEGVVILETVEYDVAIMEGSKDTPPPFPMFEAEIQSLFELNFTVNFLERSKFILKGKEILIAYYMMMKKK